MEIVQPIPTRAKIARAWLEHAHSFDRCVTAYILDIGHQWYGQLTPVKTR